MQETIGVVDRIQGFSILAIFNELASSTTTAPQLVDQLQWLLFTGNTTADYDTLRISHGF